MVQDQPTRPFVDSLVLCMCCESMRQYKVKMVQSHDVTQSFKMVQFILSSCSTKIVHAFSKLEVTNDK